MSIKSVYDKRYLENYREQLSGFEIARYKALEHFINRVLRLGSAKKVLDYGAGSGLYVSLWKKLFPDAEIHFCDISSVAMEKFIAKFQEYKKNYFLINDQQPILDEGVYDVVVSIEVMEHVEDLNFYVSCISRMLKPGGHFVWTTPCANRFSIEHIYSAITKKIQLTDEKYRRWSWEDPTHLRRLRSDEIKALLRNRGFIGIKICFRAHLFSFLCTHFPTRYAQNFRNKIMLLDYALFRYLPNGASMIGEAKKS